MLFRSWLSHNYTVFPYWDDQRTDNLGWVGCTGYPGGTCGVYTSVSGTAPNRIFNIEWRAVYFANTALSANYELRLYEGQTRFDVIYGSVANGNSSATAGVQKDNTTFTQYFCNGTGGAASGHTQHVALDTRRGGHDVVPPRGGPRRRANEARSSG